MPAISVIVPCHNGARFLSAAVASVRGQSFSDWELVIVDDGSSDATATVVAGCVAADPRIRGYAQPHRGASTARNLGAARADPSSRYFFFLDSDDWLAPDALARMGGYLDARPDVGLVTCQFEDADADGTPLGTGHRSRWVPGRILPRALRPEEIATPFVTFFCATGQGPFALFRRAVFSLTEGWETAFWPHDDTDMFCQMGLLGSVHCLPDRLYFKRLHPAQGTNDGVRMQRAYEAFRAKWNQRPARSEAEAAELAAALRHYLAWHRPCREFKTAALNLAKFCRRPHRAALRAAGGFLRSGLASWLRHAVFARVGRPK